MADLRMVKIAIICPVCKETVVTVNGVVPDHGDSCTTSGGLYTAWESVGNAGVWITTHTHKERRDDA